MDNEYKQTPCVTGILVNMKVMVKKGRWHSGSFLIEQDSMRE
ncbi:hypothetical protein SAMN02745152_01986 [Treponema berlinense]|uniref:Uncharacterized protein n=1 Tax=Treponema berlinense TaxID=225004 RepID=A0A1T4QHM2_9SPIR|nr:hypothetical protein SAMN02745152_01986 [Treponema berlinense]